MTLENYEKAKEIIAKIDYVNDEIGELRYILDNGNLSKWRMEVRCSASTLPKRIDHCGMLPEFMQTILEKKLAIYKELKKELEEL